jgi:hypothetical protein
MTENNSNILDYIIPIASAIIAGIIAYIIAIKQNKSGLKIKKVDYLENKILKLSAVREIIITRKLDLPINQIITNEQMGSLAIDSIVDDIFQILKISEYFDKIFIDKISDFNDELQKMMGQAKMGKQIDELKARELVNQIPEVNIIIRKQLDDVLKKTHKQLNSIF